MSRRFSRNEKEKWAQAAPAPQKRSPVRIPQSDNNNLIEANKLTIIGRVTNPNLQRPRAVIDFLPQIWNLEGRVAGRDLGPDKFQFRFESEADIAAVLNKGPYHYKRWMLILQRWEPVVSDAFPSTISFWLRVHGLPLHFWNDLTLETIGREIGPVSGKAADDARIRVDMNGLSPLVMNLEVRLPSDEIISIDFEYLKIEKHCFVCFSLLHEENDCPARPRFLPPPKERKLGITQRIALQRIEADKKRHDDRRGYSRPLPPSERSRDATDEESRPRRYHSQESRDERSSFRRPNVQRDSPRALYHRGFNNDRSSLREESHHRELSSGKIVGHRETTLAPHRDRSHSGGNTSKHLGSHSSHTPPPKSAHDRLEFPQEHNSGISLSSSVGRRSVLERIADPTMDNTPRITTRLSSTPVAVGDSSSSRIHVSQRLTEPEANVETVEISIPAKMSKTASKRRVTTSRKKVSRSPLQALKVKKVTGAKTQASARRKLAIDRHSDMPCNKASTSIIPKSTSTRTKKSKTLGKDFQPPLPPLP